jgi:hypothetical protein
MPSNVQRSTGAAVALHDRAPVNPIETEARAILRDRLSRFPWHPDVPESERARLVEQDIDTYWHLYIGEATERMLRDVPKLRLVVSRS